MKNLIESNDTVALDKFINDYAKTHPENSAKIDKEQIYVHPNFTELIVRDKDGIQLCRGAMIHNLALLR